MQHCLGEMCGTAHQLLVARSHQAQRAAQRGTSRPRAQQGFRLGEQAALLLVPLEQLRERGVGRRLG